MEDMEDRLKIGDIIKVKWPSTDSDRFQKAVILKKKLMDTNKNDCKYKFKLQLVDDEVETVKVRLCDIEWKPVSEKRKNNDVQEAKELLDDSNGIKKSKKKEKANRNGYEISSLPLIRSFPSFKKSIPDSVLRYIVAPMVGASELAFRLLCRRYGATLAYTPMMNSERFAFDDAYRQEEFQTVPEDRPVVAHFCANNPETFLKAVKHVENQCDAIGKNRILSFRPVSLSSVFFLVIVLLISLKILT
jgi:hypothetical protein